MNTPCLSISLSHPRPGRFVIVTSGPWRTSMLCINRHLLCFSLKARCVKIYINKTGGYKTFQTRSVYLTRKRVRDVREGGEKNPRQTIHSNARTINIICTVNVSVR